MKKKKVALLGATGMLGSMLLNVFAGSGEFTVIATGRSAKTLKLLKDKYAGIDVRVLDAHRAGLNDVLQAIKGAQWVINAIGITKPYIHDDNPEEIERAIMVNAVFPHVLAYAARKTKAYVLQIATDCVYSGRKGRYVETDPHDALDVYGKTKSLGEVVGRRVYHLRCSIIGPEQHGHRSLLDWFLGQLKRARVDGFTNHRWNGITTLAFARICMGVIRQGITLPHIQHIVPAHEVNKAQLLKLLARAYKRKDVMIKDTRSPDSVDRTLATKNKELNRRLWRLAGYNRPPTIEEMVGKLAHYV